jgi:hypothetical protein
MAELIAPKHPVPALGAAQRPLQTDRARPVLDCGLHLPPRPTSSRMRTRTRDWRGAGKAGCAASATKMKSAVGRKPCAPP